MKWSYFELKVKEENKNIKRVQITNASDLVPIVRKDIGSRDRECFIRYDLDSKGWIIGKEIISIGLVNASLVHPREVFKGAFLNGAVSIIVAHNHPSGDTEPSKEDRKVNEVILEAGKLLGIDVLDSIIVSRDSYWSHAENS